MTRFTKLAYASSQPPDYLTHICDGTNVAPCTRRELDCREYIRHLNMPLIKLLMRPLNQLLNKFLKQ